MNIWNYLYARRLPLLILVSLLAGMWQLGILRSMLASLFGEFHVFAVSMGTYVVLFLVVCRQLKRERQATGPRTVSEEADDFWMA